MIYKRMFLCITYRFFCIEKASRGRCSVPIQYIKTLALRGFIHSLNLWILWNFRYDFYDNRKNVTSKILV